MQNDTSSWVKRILRNQRYSLSYSKNVNRVNTFQKNFSQPTKLNEQLSISNIIHESKQNFFYRKFLFSIPHLKFQNKQFRNLTTLTKT